MIFTNWIRSAVGYIEFEVSGAFTEKFLNTAAQNGLSVWDIKRNRDTVRACTRISDYKKMRKAARKSMVKLKIIKKRGLPFKRYRYRKRIGLVIGAVLFVVSILVMSMFIWRVEIHGIETLNEKELLDILSEHGIKSGVLKRSIDVEKIENEMRIAVPQIGWIAINLEGSCAEVEIKERTMPPQMKPDDDILCNIVASKSGKITRMEVYAGQPVLKEGDAVNKGDLIVSGILEDKKGKTTFKHARAKIFAQVQDKIRVEVPFEKTVRVQCGESKKKNAVKILGAEIPFYFTKKDLSKYDIEESEKEFNILGVHFSLVSCVFTPIEEKTVTLNEHEAKEEAMKQLNEREKSDLEGCKILSKSLSSGVCGDNKSSFFVEAEYKYEQDIALERQVLTEK